MKTSTREVIMLQDQYNDLQFNFLLYFEKLCLNFCVKQDGVFNDCFSRLFLILLEILSPFLLSQIISVLGMIYLFNKVQYTKNVVIQYFSLDGNLERFMDSLIHSLGQAFVF